MYNKNGSLKYHFNQYELNVKVYQCFRTRASQVYITCVDQGIFIREGSIPDGKNTDLPAFFWFVLCSLQPINRGFPMVLFQRGSIIFQGVHLFPGTGGGGGGGGGPNVDFYRNPYITFDFLSPPLDPRMHNNLYTYCSSLLKLHKICNRQYLFVLLARKSQYHVNCPLAYDTHLKMPKLNLSEI